MTVEMRTVPQHVGPVMGTPVPQFTNFDKLGDQPDVRAPSAPPVGFQGNDPKRSMHRDRANAAYGAMQRELITADKGRLQARLHSDSRERAPAWPYGQLVAGAMDRALVTGDMSEARKALDGLQEYLLRDGSYNAMPNEKGNRFYDDNAWIGLDLVQGFRMTGDQKYIDAARKTFDFLMQGMQPDGGMKWHEKDRPNNRPAATQGPTLQLALHLYELTGEQKYKDTAQKLDGFMNQLRTGPNGAIIDTVMADGSGNDGSLFTYNQGTAIGADVQMYEMFGDASKLERAKKLANETLNTFDDKRLFEHAPGFNGVLVRNLLQLERVLPDGDPVKARIRPAIQRYLDRADSQARSPEGFYGGNGLGKYNDHETKILDQSAFVQMHALLAMTPEQLEAVA